jgi:hypothetical protein
MRRSEDQHRLSENRKRMCKTRTFFSRTVYTIRMNSAHSSVCSEKQRPSMKSHSERGAPRNSASVQGRGKEKGRKAKHLRPRSSSRPRPTPGTHRSISRPSSTLPKMPASLLGCWTVADGFVLEEDTWTTRTSWRTTIRSLTRV